ncbi:MAG: hypothetical protein Q4C57_01565 [Bacillota bacterium]|nr:hypothetical protein [Bacillota bacterium]
MSKRNDLFQSALTGKRIPILTLDNKWHKIFTQKKPDKKLKRLEDELNELLKKQGKLTGEVKEIKKLKKKLMDGIVANASEASVENDEKAVRKAQESTRLIDECNEKLEEYEEELLELPREIDKVNKELMLLTMEICYDRLKENEQRIEEDARWVSEVREELKRRLVRKQEMEQANQELYSYLHDIFGAEVIELFDLKYEEDT